jgi:hypothetical protein
MKYFFISNGLRGCYMPDDVSVQGFKTRRDLLACVEHEAREMIEAYGFGYSSVTRHAIVAQIWREAVGRATKQRLDHVIGFGRTRSTSDRPFGLFISHATRRDFLDYCKETEG